MLWQESLSGLSNRGKSTCKQLVQQVMPDCYEVSMDATPAATLETTCCCHAACCLLTAVEYNTEQSHRLGQVLGGFCLASAGRACRSASQPVCQGCGQGHVTPVAMIMPCVWTLAVMRRLRLGREHRCQQWQREECVAQSGKQACRQQDSHSSLGITG